jgi:hypothetical protein
LFRKVLAESVTLAIRRVKRGDVKKKVCMMRFWWTVRGGDDKLCDSDGDGCGGVAAAGFRKPALQRQRRWLGRCGLVGCP